MNFCWTFRLSIKSFSENWIPNMNNAHRKMKENCSSVIELNSNHRWHHLCICPNDRSLEAKRFTFSHPSARGDRHSKQELSSHFRKPSLRSGTHILSLRSGTHIQSLRSETHILSCKVVFSIQLQTNQKRKIPWGINFPVNATKLVAHAHHHSLMFHEGLLMLLS